MYEIKYGGVASELCDTAEEAREMYSILMRTWRKGILLCDHIPSIVDVERKTESRIIGDHVEIRYVGEPWTGWNFSLSEERKPYWIYMPEFGMWRCNCSRNNFI